MAYKWGSVVLMGERQVLDIETPCVTESMGNSTNECYLKGKRPLHAPGLISNVVMTSVVVVSDLCVDLLPPFIHTERTSCPMFSDLFGVISGCRCITGVLLTGAF